jgi:hypothetical protein
MKLFGYRIKYDMPKAFKDKGKTEELYIEHKKCIKNIALEQKLEVKG